MNVLDILNSPWAIQPETLQEMCAIYAAHRNGDKTDIKAIEAAAGRSFSNEPKPYSVQDGVAMIPIEGVLSKRMSMFAQICGGMSYTSLQQDLSTALNDPDVTGIILTIDSPGGAVDGVQAAGDAIFAARSQKPIVAYVDGKATSAAYWLGSAASQMYVGSDTDQVGSIGVVTQHVDTSNAEHQRGVKITDIAAGRYKAVGSQHAPLSAQDRNSIQDHLDQLYGTFVDTVARNRGVDSQTVLSNMADGRVFVGQKAIDAGLVDGKTTLPQLIQRMKSQQGGATMGAPNSKPTKGNAAMPAAEQETTFTSAQLQTARDEAHKAGFDAGLTQGRTEGATTERDRIQAVEKVTLPGHEALVAGLKFDGKTSGPEAAVQVLQAEQKLRDERLSQIRSEAPNPVPESTGTAAADAQTAAGAASPVSAESKAKDMAKSARELVAKAKAEGKTLTYAAAVKQVMTAK
jgi:signal peptide peptidase SppA